MIKTGLAAFGMSGQVFHAPFISTNPHFELTAVVERSKNISQEKYPNTRIVRSFQALLAIEEIELIVVNTPDSLHYEHAKQALEAGKHVIVEKPFTSTVAQGEELIALAKERKRMLSVYQNRRWDADFRTVQQVIEEGMLGRLVEFQSTFPRYRNYIAPNTWKETGEWGGGLLYNLGAHLIDQAVLLFGMPKAIYADVDCLREGGHVDDYFVLHFIEPAKMPQLKLTLKSGYLICDPEPRFVLHGTEGSFTKYGIDPQEEMLKAGALPTLPRWGEEAEADWGTLRLAQGNETTASKHPSTPGDYRLFYQNIHEHLCQGAPLQTNAEDILPIIKLIETAYANNRKVTTIGS